MNNLVATAPSSSTLANFPISRLKSSTSILLLFHVDNNQVRLPNCKCVVLPTSSITVEERQHAHPLYPLWLLLALVRRSPVYTSHTLMFDMFTYFLQVAPSCPTSAPPSSHLQAQRNKGIMHTRLLYREPVVPMKAGYDMRLTFPAWRNVSYGQHCAVSFIRV